MTGNHEVPSARYDCAFGKGVINGALQKPFGQINVDGHLIVQFHPFIGCLVCDGVIVNLVEDNDTIDGNHGMNYATEQQEKYDQSLHSKMVTANGLTERISDRVYRLYDHARKPSFNLRESIHHCPEVAREKACMHHARELNRRGVGNIWLCELMGYSIFLFY